MYYFDNRFLQQYLDQRKPLKVCVGSVWYDVADKGDLSDNLDGIGYDVYGKDHRFDYRDITQIKVGNQTYTLEQLQAFMTQKPEEEKEKKGSSNSEPSPEEEPPVEEPEPKKEKEPELAHFSKVYDIGKMLVKEAGKRRLHK
jgi:hypothetical protein